MTDVYMSEEDDFVLSEEESDFEESAVVIKKKPLQENRNVTNSTMTTTTKKTKNVEETYQKLSQLEVRVCVGWIQEAKTRILCLNFYLCIPPTVVCTVTPFTKYLVLHYSIIDTHSSLLLLHYHHNSTFSNAPTHTLAL